MPSRLLHVAGWAPAVACLASVYVLARRLPDIVGQLTWNPDYVSQIALAESAARSGLPHRAVIVQIGYFWVDLATAWIPFHNVLWDYWPAALAAASLGLLAWTSWRVAGRMAAVTTVALGLGASPLVLATELAQAYHGSTWFGMALLAAYSCWLVTGPHSLRRLVLVSLVTGLLVGFATASDPLLGPAGDAPFGVAMIVVWRARSGELPARHLAAAAGMVGVALLMAGTTVLAGRLLGFTSTFPRGLTHLVTAQHFAGNLHQLVSGIFEVAGMPHEGSDLGLALGLILVAGLLVPPAWLIVAVRRREPPSLLGLLAFWSASAVFVALAFLLSDIPADFLNTSSRYLVSMYFVVVATVPVWAARRPGRTALVAAPAVALILAGAAAVERDAGAGAFRPSYSFALGAPIAFLEQHGLVRGYAAYEDASPMTIKTGLRLEVRPLTEFFVAPGDGCGPPPLGTICPYAYNSASDWYAGRAGPTFILVDPAVTRLGRPPPPGLDEIIAIYEVDRFTIYVYGDDVASHMRLPQRFTRALF